MGRTETANAKLFLLIARCPILPVLCPACHGTAMNATHAHDTRNGLIAAVTTYLLWGFLPVLFHLLRAVPAFDVVAWRVVFSFPVCLAFIALTAQHGEIIAALRQPRVMLRLALSAGLIGFNWLTYVSAVENGHVLAASLGYYINPLVTVGLGTLILGERLSRRQWVAVAIAAMGIALLSNGAWAMLGTALALALSFALYGLVRKTTPVGSITALGIETLLLTPAAIGWVAVGHITGEVTGGGLNMVLLAASGLATAVPLILFGVAARHLPLSTLGFLQFIAPTLVFLVGIVLGEHLDPQRLGCFVLIWIALGLFACDGWQTARANRSATAS